MSMPTMPIRLSELHRDELVVDDRFGLRNAGKNAELLERMTDDVDRRRVPCTIAREPSDLSVVDPGCHGGFDVDRPGADLHREILVGPHEGHGAEPAAQEL